MTSFTLKLFIFQYLSNIYLKNIKPRLGTTTATCTRHSDNGRCQKIHAERRSLQSTQEDDCQQEIRNGAMVSWRKTFSSGQCKQEFYV